MNPVTGQIFVHTPLDREKIPIYQLKIQASDSPLQSANQRSSYIDITVILEDINDNKPTFDKASYYSAVKETADVSDDVISVQAVDADQGNLE